MEGDKLKDSKHSINLSEESGSQMHFKNVTHTIVDQFNKEIDDKLKLIQLVERNIAKSQIILKRLRYAIIASYYRNDLNLKDVTSIFEQLETGGKNDETYSKFQIHPSLNSNIVESSSLDEKVELPRQNNEHEALQRITTGINIPEQNYQKIFKNVTILNNKIQLLLVVGNTSKYINENNQPLFKWVAYVQIKNHNKRIEAIVKKVRFRLHPSYKPNDVLEINSPPFQIIQLGWGGFPLCVQVFFHNELKQKPIQLTHNLVLDKSLSGLHTLGAETVFEIWLPADKIPSGYEKNSFTKNLSVENKSKFSNVKTEDHDSDFNISSERHEFKMVKAEDHDLDFNISTEQLELKLGKTERKGHFSLDATSSTIRSANRGSHIQSCFYADNIQNVTVNGPSELIFKQKQEPSGSEAKEDSQNSKDLKNISFNCNALGSDAFSPGSVLAKNVFTDNCDEKCSPDQRIEKFVKGCRESVSLLNKSYHSDFCNKNHQYFRNEKNKNIVFQKKGKLYIIDPSQIKYRQAQLRQESLLKTNITSRPKIFWLSQENDLHRKGNTNDLGVDKYLNKSQKDHDYACSPTDNIPMGISKKKTRLKSNQSFVKYLQSIFRNMAFENFKDVVDKFLKAFPIIPMHDKLYIDLPFMAKSFHCFQKRGPIKQRVLEWLRARYLVKLIKIHPQVRELLFKRNHLFWTTKEILRYARYKEKTPNVLSFQMESKNQVVSIKDGIYLNEINVNKARRTLSCNYYIYEHVHSLRHNLNVIKEKHSITTNVDVIKTETKRNSPRLFKVDTRQKNVAQSIFGSTNNLVKYLQHISNGGHVSSMDGVNSISECHTVEILFAHCIYLLIEKLTKYALYKQVEGEENSDLILNPEAILEAILRCDELDFLTNICLGICE